MDVTTIDPRIPFLVLIFAAVFSAGQAISGLVRVGTAKRAVNRRLQLVERSASLGDLVLELRKDRGVDEHGNSVMKLRFISDIIFLSGIPYRPTQWALVMMGVMVGVAGATFVMWHNPILSVVAGPVAGIVGPIVYLKYLGGRRAKMLADQLPNALEVIVRSLEAGHPVPTAVSLVGRELPDPIGTEFGMAADEIAYGATLEQAVARIANRCRHPDIDLFAANIRLQEKSGGNLTGLLKTLARTVRERLKMRLKIKAASAEGATSAYILTAAPFCVFGLLWFASPHFYGDVIGERPIQMGLMMLGGWMFIGNMIMRRMIDMRI
jgi:tight adherence protein B